MNPFRAAVEAMDFQAIENLIADDVAFSSPVLFKPYEGKAITLAILRNVIEVFQDFRYIREIGAPDASDHALIFEAEVNGKTLTGCDFLHFNAEGKIDDFMVMVRPLNGAQELFNEMSARFDQIVEQATAYMNANA